MPQIGRWAELPEAVRQHLVERMRDRAVSLSDLNQLPVDGNLVRGQAAKGEAL